MSVSLALQLSIERHSRPRFVSLGWSDPTFSVINTLRLGPLCSSTEKGTRPRRRRVWFPTGMESQGRILNVIVTNRKNGQGVVKSQQEGSEKRKKDGQKKGEEGGDGCWRHT